MSGPWGEQMVGLAGHTDGGGSAYAAPKKSEVPPTVKKADKDPTRPSPVTPASERADLSL